MSKTASDRTVSVVIPAYNEAGTIEGVVSDVVAVADRVVVVDDGSADDTGELAEAAGATVLVHEANKGYDRSLSDGVAYAAEHGADVIVTFDGDGQHDPADIERIVEPILADRASIVVGCRPEYARVAERLFALYAKWRLGVTDPLSGFKAYDVAVYEDIGSFDTYNSVGTYLLLVAERRGYTVEQIDIAIEQREGDSRFGSLRGNLVILRALWRTIVFDIRSAFERLRE